MALITGTIFNDNLVGSGGNETIRPLLSADNTTGDFVDGGGGTQDILEIDYTIENLFGITFSPGGTNAGIYTSGRYRVTFSNIERFNIIGTPFDDILQGGNGIDVLNGGDGRDTISGLGGNDTIIGGAGNDVLDGGLGADTLTGGLGNDYYMVERASDVVIEAPGEGRDTIASTISYSLESFPNIENLRLIVGSNARTGTGNDSNNTIWGNQRNNTLDGGAGNDTLFGYGDKDNLTGGAGIDTLHGGDGDDILNGGADRDKLNGGAGADTFILDTLSFDSINDFSAAEGDRIRISKSAFGLTSLNTGSLNSANFVIGSGDLDANDFIIYDNVRGSLRFDTNGNLPGGVTGGAGLRGAPSLSNVNIFIID